MVTTTDDPQQAQERAVAFLAQDPVAHNLVLTLLEERRAQAAAGRGVPGHYAIAATGGVVTGCTFRSPLGFPAVLAAADLASARTLAAAAAGHGRDDPVHRLAGVSGPPYVAAAFAGHYTEAAGGGALVTGAQRLYRLDPRELAPPVTGTAGTFRAAGPDDADLMGTWSGAFAEELGTPPPGPGEVAGRLAAGRLFVWESGGRVVSMAGHAPAVAGVARVYAVYTPPDWRGRGHAEGCVRALSQLLMDRGLVPVLFTDLANGTSNALYRRVGYRAVGERLTYRFLPGPG